MKKQLKLVLQCYVHNGDDTEDKLYKLVFWKCNKKNEYKIIRKIYKYKNISPSIFAENCCNYCLDVEEQYTMKKKGLSGIRIFSKKIIQEKDVGYIN